MYAATRLAVCSTLCVIFMTDTAYAYLDPGTGSMLLQGLIAVIAGGLVMMRLYWAKVKSFFSSNKKKDDNVNKEQP